MNAAIMLDDHEREIVASIWKAPDYRNDPDRLAAIESRIGRQLGRGWCRLHFGPPGPEGRPFRSVRERSPEEARRINEGRWPYLRYATNDVMNVGMNYLSELVVRPGIRRRLEPLCLYRGAMTPGSAHRYWNYALLMMAAEAETLADGMKLYGNAAFAQLCGPHKPPEKYRLKVFFGRLWDNPDVTDNISGLTEYVKSLELGPSHLTPVPYVSHDQYCAPWRVSDHPEYDPKAERPEYGIRAKYYPYLVHDPKKLDDGHALVLLANQLVPKVLPDQMRADVCQDLVEGILTGKVAVDDARDFVLRYIRDNFKLHPTVWDRQNNKATGRPISFNQPKGQYSGGDDILWTERV